MTLAVGFNQDVTNSWGWVGVNPSHFSGTQVRLMPSSHELDDRLIIKTTASCSIIKGCADLCNLGFLCFVFLSYCLWNVFDFQWWFHIGWNALMWFICLTAECRLFCIHCNNKSKAILVKFCTVYIKVFVFHLLWHRRHCSSVFCPILYIALVCYLLTISEYKQIPHSHCLRKRKAH